MTIGSALRQGCRILNQAKGVWLWFYAATTLAGALGAAAVMSIPFSSLGHSAWAERMAGNFDLEWIAELIAANGALPAWPLLVALVGVFSIASLAYVFFLGGALELFCARQPFSTQAFFAGCGKHFWRLLRLAFYTAICCAVVSAIGRLLTSTGTKIWGEGSEAAPLIYWTWFRVAVVLGLLGLVNLAFEYAGIRLATEDSRKSLRALLGSFRFVWRHPGPAVGLYVAAWILALLVIAAYVGISRVVAQTSVGMVLVLLIVRQVAVVGKIWTGLLFYASQSAMYESLMPPPAAMPESEVHPEAEPQPTLEIQGNGADTATPGEMTHPSTES